MKNIVVKGAIIAGVAVGIAALSVAVQRFVSKIKGDISDSASDIPLDDGDLDVILRQSMTSSEPKNEDDNDVPEAGAED